MGDPDPLGTLAPWGVGGSYMFRSYFDYFQALIYITISLGFRKNVLVCGVLTSWDLSNWANSVIPPQQTSFWQNCKGLAIL
jgi:hypothetical protein